jgi:Methyltransferase domain
MAAFEGQRELKERARKAYDSLEEIWPATDPWSAHTESSIQSVINEFVDPSCRVILNAGCGNNEYGLSDRMGCINLDISLRQCIKVNCAVVADVEAIPFVSNYFDATICVGAVLNYAEPYAALPELARVTKRRGMIIVDVETTNTAELFLSRDWAKRVSVVERNYAGRLDKTFLFSVAHIARLLEQCGVELVTIRRYHLTTALWLRLFPKSRTPARIISIDRLASRIPGLRYLSSNAIFVCQKR